MRRQLTYKANWPGCQLVVVNRLFPSSKTCADCGQINAAVRLATALEVRTMQCALRVWPRSYQCTLTPSAHCTDDFTFASPARSHRLPISP
ncbi:zinc ribbon domain-containing protein [Lysobacter sp. GCM10012299]|uniref:zinc ribbon domain-containing protein n=1 Tax=Lysobacter sp. GCM10012299 TaxID=3317333 RepID=UPI003612C062